MTVTRRRKGKTVDGNILKLNAVGLSLGTIAQLLDIHPSSVTLRLKDMGVPPTDTRRAFMEDVIAEMTEDVQEALTEHLDSTGLSIKEYVRNLISKDLG